MTTLLLRGLAFLGLLLSASVDVAAEPPRVDALGDSLPEGAKARLGTTQPQRISPPQKGQEPELIASVWDVGENRELTRVSTDGEGRLVPVLSPDGKTLAAWFIPTPRWTPPPPRQPGDPELAPAPRP